MADSPWFWFGLQHWGCVWAALGYAAGKRKGRAFSGLVCGLMPGPFGPALMLASDPVPDGGTGADTNAPPTY